MTTRPHDALFKAGFELPEHAAGLFRAALPASLADAIAWGTMEPEPGSFIDPELADSHSDLLFSVELQGRRAFLYLLLEHQSSNDPDMPLRMLSYMVRIWERLRKTEVEEGVAHGPLPPIIPALVSHVPGGWTAPRSFEDLVDPHPATIPARRVVPAFSLLLEDLADLSNDDIMEFALEPSPRWCCGRCGTLAVAGNSCRTSCTGPRRWSRRGERHAGSRRSASCCGTSSW